MISHDYKLIFIHIPKCAGRSICNVFNQRFDHFTAEYYYREYSHFRHYNYFTIVRHPLDRLVSIFHYIQEHRRHQYEPIGSIKEFKPWLLSNLERFYGNFNSPEVDRGADGQIGTCFWFSSQYDRIVVNGTPICKVFRYENMQEVQEYLRKMTNNNLLEIPYTNISTHKDWRYYYDTELMDRISRFYPLIKDIKKFGYEV